jgi:hypothetical protein
MEQVGRSSSGVVHSNPVQKALAAQVAAPVSLCVTVNVAAALTTGSVALAPGFSEHSKVTSPGSYRFPGINALATVVPMYVVSMAGLDNPLHETLRISALKSLPPLTVRPVPTYAAMTTS